MHTTKTDQTSRMPKQVFAECDAEIVKIFLYSSSYLTYMSTKSYCKKKRKGAYLMIFDDN